MPRYVAFLRAINVGGRVVKMDRLRALFESLALADVETFIASGNVIFTTGARSAGPLEQKIEAHLERELGYKVETFLRTPAELAVIGVACPFGAEHPTEGEQNLYVSFFKSALAPDAGTRLAALETPDDKFRIIGREMYWLSRTGLGQTTVKGAEMGRALGGMPSTNRNVTTVRKLVAKYPA